MRARLLLALLVIAAQPLFAVCTTQPTAAVTGSQTICAQGGSSAHIFANLAGTPPFTITWSDGLFDNSIFQSTYERMVPASAQPYTITSITDADCNSGTFSGAAVVSEYPLSTANLSGDTTICQGASAVVTAQMTGTLPSTSIGWMGRSRSASPPPRCSAR